MPGIMQLMGAGPQVIAAAALDYDATILAESSLVAYYPLSESSGSALDSKGGQSGTVGSAVTRGATGILPHSDGKTAYSFNGTSNAKVTFTGYFRSTYPITLEAWVKFTSFGTGAVLGQTSGSHGAAMMCDSQYQLYDVAGANITSNQNLSTGTVYYLVITSDGTNAGTKFYWNGTLATTNGSGQQPEVADVAGAQIGQITGAGNHNGIIQKVAIYNAVLSSAQVTAHYNKGLSG